MSQRDTVLTSSLDSGPSTEETDNESRGRSAELQPSLVQLGASCRVGVAMCRTPHAATWSVCARRSEAQA
jgi:hypothetical protein